MPSGLQRPAGVDSLGLLDELRPDWSRADQSCPADSPCVAATCSGEAPESGHAAQSSASHTTAGGARLERSKFRRPESRRRLTEAMRARWGRSPASSSSAARRSTAISPSGRATRRRPGARDGQRYEPPIFAIAGGGAPTQCAAPAAETGVDPLRACRYDRALTLLAICRHARRRRARRQLPHRQRA